MAAIIKILLFLFFSSTVWAAPDNSMSILPTAVEGNTITAADENTRNSEIATKYNAHSHTDTTQTGNTLKVGDGNAGDKEIQANTNDANKPFIRFDDSENNWVISRDGVTILTFMVMTGNDVDQSILPESPSNNDVLVFDTTDDQWKAQSTVILTTGTFTNIDIGTLDAALDANNQAITNINIDSGTIDNVSSGNIDINGGSYDGGTIGDAVAVTGTFNGVYLPEQSSDLGTTASEAVLYTKDTGGQPELYFREESNGDTVQLTTAGVVNSAIKLLSTTTVSGGTNTGDITLGANKFFMVSFEINTIGAGQLPWLRFNSSSSGTAYAWVTNRLNFSTTPSDSLNGSNSDAQIVLSSVNPGNFQGTLFIDTHNSNTSITGSYIDLGTGGIRLVGDFNAAANDFEILFAGGTTFSATIKTYELQ